MEVVDRVFVGGVFIFLDFCSISSSVCVVIPMLILLVSSGSCFYLVVKGVKQGQARRAGPAHSPKKMG